MLERMKKRTLEMTLELGDETDQELARQIGKCETLIWWKLIKHMRAWGLEMT